jgi:hypothetical protein
VAAPVKLHKVEQWRRAAVQREEEDMASGFRGRRLHLEKTNSEGTTLPHSERGIELSRLQAKKAEILEVRERWQPKLTRSKEEKGQAKTAGWAKLDKDFKRRF